MSSQVHSLGAEVIASPGTFASTEALRGAFEDSLPAYRLDPYRHYPSARRHGWRRYAVARLDRMLADSEHLLYCDSSDAGAVLLPVRRARWDRDHFGFGVATIGGVYASDDAAAGPLEGLLDSCLDRLRDEGMRFVSARLPGDLLTAIHLFEDRGFRFYETMTWVAGKVGARAEEGHSPVRLMVEDDLERVLEIASNHQYQRGHFHCDPGFDRQAADRLYARWIETSWKNGEPIAVIEHDGGVAGYFSFRLAETLSRAMGCSYGRLRSLALADAARGRGLGTVLLAGALRLIGEHGGELADCAFATKNHQSARVHFRNGLHPVHEEVTLHLWL